MIIYFVVAGLALIGLAMGSFAGALVWRLRARQLKEDAAEGYKTRKKDVEQVSKLRRKGLLRDRSVCLHCGHKLTWRDLIPLASWAALRGKCRYCHKKIGLLEPAVELGVAAFFVVSYLLWPLPLDTPLELLQFSVWLASGVGLAVLLIYDAKWFLLPDRVMYPLFGLGTVYSVLVLVSQQFAPSQLFSILMSVAILSGLYYVIYVVSRHQWVGFGDVKLGVVLALLLADWQLALIALFLANVIGTLFLLPLMLNGKVKRHAHVPFGPFLIAGWFLAGVFGQQIISWYFSLVPSYF